VTVGTPLTDEVVALAVNYREGAARVELIDGAEPGLRLRLGGRVAQWSVLTRGAVADRMRLPLGTWPTMTVEQARTLAKALKGTFASVTAADQGEATLGSVLLRYNSRRLSQLRKGAVMGRALDVALAPLKHRALSEITRREICFIIDEMADRAPIHANRVLAYAKAFLNWAVGRGYIEHNPASAIAKPTRERTRDRAPTVSELAEIWMAASQLGYPFGPAVQLLMLTAARRDEVGAMRLAEVDIGNDPSLACWIIPAERSKNGRSIRVPLAPCATKILDKSLEARPPSGTFVFTTTGRSPISGWSKAKARIDSIISASRVMQGREPITPWRIHDLRRSFATSACDVLHIDPAVADRCLNHVGAGTTSTVSRIYSRNELFDQRRDALAKWAKLLQGVVALATEPNAASEALADNAPT
jgi:integrase